MAAVFDVAAEEGLLTGEGRRAVGQAVQVCAGCPLQQSCRQDAEARVMEAAADPAKGRYLYLGVQAGVFLPAEVKVRTSHTLAGDDSRA